MLHVLLAAILTPSEVVAKAIAAVGVQEPGTYRIETRGAFGDGTISFERYEQGSNYAETEHDTDITTAQGQLDGVDWTEDASGVVLTRNTSSLFEDPYRNALEKPDAPASGLHVETDASGNVVLEVTPRAGLTKRYSYDPSTFLPSRIDYEDSAGRRSYIFTGYKRYFGLMAPSHIQYISPFANNSATYELVAYDRVPAATAKLAIPSSKAVFDLGTHASLPIPAQFSTEGIVVRVNVAGRGLDFILDSGASESVIDADVARELGLRLHSKRTLAYFGTTSLSQTTIDDFALGEIHAPHFVIAAIPFSERVDQKKVVGLLGGDFFASGRIAVDFGAETVTMLAPTTQLPTNGWTKLPIQVTGFIPVTEAVFSGFKGTFVIDTGAWSTVFYRHYFAKFTPDKIASVQGRAVGISGQGFDYRPYHAPRMDIGDLAYADVLVQVLDTGKADDYSIDGLIGRTFLDNFSLIFDYADRTLYIKPEIQ